MRRTFLPLAGLVELGARRDQHLAGPVADLGEEDAGGLAVGEEDMDGLAGHGYGSQGTLRLRAEYLGSLVPASFLRRSV